MAARSAGSSSVVILEEPQAVDATLVITPVALGPQGRREETLLGQTLGAPQHPAAGDDTSCGAAAPRTDVPPEEPRAADVVPKVSTTALALTMMSLCLSSLLSALDLTVVTTALPAIVGDFKSDTGYIWIGSAFILPYTAITPIWGSVADIWGRKPIILTALAVFLAGTLLCAQAPTMDAMIIGRAVQGIGASGLGVMVNVIVSDLFSLRDRGLYLAILSVVWAVGSAIGPLLGGAMTSKLGWRWCFWINLPIGAVVGAVLFFFLDIPSPHTPVLEGLKAIDWMGSILVIGGALMILLALDFGDVSFAWSSVTVICLLVFGAATIGLFIFNEWKLTRNPIMPLRLFKTLSTSAAISVLAANFYVYIGLTYYLPLYTQSVLGASPLVSGVYMIPLIVSCSLTSALAGILIQQTGRYLELMYAAQVMLTLGMGLFINLEFEQNITKLVIYEIIVGVGVGLNIEPPSIAALANTAPRDAAALISSMGFIRSMATTVSVVLGGVIFQNEMNAANPGLASEVGEHIASVFKGGQAAANVELLGTLPENLQTPIKRAYFEGLRKVWIMYVAFAGLATFLNLFVRAHRLSKEKNETVLGLDRHKPEATQTASEVGPDATELRSRGR